MIRTALSLAFAVSFLAAGCGGDGQSSGSNGSTTLQDPSCGARGKPVTIDELVRIFRSNGITLDVNQRKCEGREPTEPDATNAGPSALEMDDDVKRAEGVVLCDAGTMGDRREVIVTKYPTDDESTLRVLNITCTIYPSSAASESKQIAQLRNALEAVVRDTPSN